MYYLFSTFLLSKAALISLGYEEVALDDFWQAFLQELDNLPNMELGQLEVGSIKLAFHLDLDENIRLLLYRSNAWVL